MQGVKGISVYTVYQCNISDWTIEGIKKCVKELNQFKHR